MTSGGPSCSSYCEFGQQVLNSGENNVSLTRCSRRNWAYILKEWCQCSLLKTKVEHVYTRGLFLGNGGKIVRIESGFPVFISQKRQNKIKHVIQNTEYHVVPGSVVKIRKQLGPCWNEWFSFLIAFCQTSRPPSLLICVFSHASGTLALTGG